MVQVPKYSDQGGEVSLPTRRLTPMSGGAIQQLAAPGRAMANMGKGAVSAGTSIANYEIDQAKKEAKMWVVSAEADLREEMTALIEDTKLKQKPDDYLANDSFQDGSNQNTYTNQIKNGFDGIINKTEKGPDGSESSRYKAPNEYTAQLWEQQKVQLKGAYANQAMGYEADLRSKAKLDKLTQSFDKYNNQVLKNPELIDISMMSIKTLAEVEDDPKTKNIEGGIKAEHLIGVSRAAQQDLVYNATIGLIREDAFLAYALLQGKRGKNFDHDLAKHLGILKPGIKEQLMSKAKIQAMVVGKKELNDLNNSVSNHVASLAAGGDGIEAFNKPNGLENAFIGTYGGPYGAIKLQMLPELYDAYEIDLKAAASKIKVARAVGQFVNGSTYLTTDEIITASRDLADLVKNKDITNMKASDVQNLILQNIGDEVVDLTKMNPVELQTFTSGVLTHMNSVLELRSSDFGEYAYNHDPIQSIEDPFEKRDAIIAYADQLGIKNPSLLPNRDAAKIVANLKSMTNPDMMMVAYGQLEQDYGEHFDRVWSQLTTMKGGLGNEWMLIGAFSKSNAGPMLAAAFAVDNDQLKKTVESYGAGFKMQKINEAVQGTMGELLHTFHGGMFGREDAGQDMRDLITTAVMMEIQKSGGKTDVTKAANIVKKTLETQIQFVNNEDAAFYVLPQHVGNNGEKINATVVNDNLTDIINDKETVMQMIVDRGIKVPPSLIPQVNADQAFASGYFADYLIANGRWVMNDTGDGLMLTYPALAGGAAASDGGGLLVPVQLHQTDSSGNNLFVEVSFADLNYTRPPGWWSSNMFEWMGGLSEAEISDMKKKAAQGKSGVVSGQ